MELIEHTAAAGTIRVEEQDGRSVVVLVGEIDAALRDEASATMGRALISGAPVVVDTTSATFIDSSGIAFVLQLHLAAREAGIPVSLRDPHRVLRDVLEMIGMGDELPAEVPVGVPEPA
ncbi:STAS domain-containing protein [Cellulomonas fimi]|uniref:Sulfate transporter/antisigma-factor antagonist STAS n=1 Tax=Cellulomonas fimi (strain ATCC 484 / DSM 20113 / JCM 1341 / CCUG 24087 / LMG 16345 / NBRC 15513 / NCIMB 8980 / NCTC 7547 / NRS-133) TaxID=590998 RepID=F4H4M2_CELFA|nr:STAS domain-containing protein [Cellulomonas fimi]AEE47817.1 Sulfate transporter/antisigma-factor antagonist STAS [Cellulomonas fimi ATCC 484]NNH06045.1 STAS domain-containing protein [Cellulomonas fimi]